MKNKYWILYFGCLCFIANTLLLWFHVDSSWCDDVAYVDLARQIGLYSTFFSNDWGYVDTCCPLYVLFLAPVIRLFGTSYFIVHIPALLFSLASYFLMAFYLDKRQLIQDKSLHALLCVAYWWLPQMFWINNCGRIENLCFLSAVGTFILFERNVNNCNWKSNLALFVMAIVMFWSGVQGIIFATLGVLVYTCFNWKSVIGKQRRISFLILFGGYGVGFFANCVLAYSQGGLSSLFNRMFGFSSTINGISESMISFLKRLKHGSDYVISVAEPAKEVATNLVEGTSVWALIFHGYTDNIQYSAIMFLTLILLGIVACRHQIKILPKIIWISFVTASVSPAVYVLAGRWTAYYSWASLVPAIITLVLLLQFLYKNRISTILATVLSSICMVWFLFAPIVDRRWDWDGTIEEEKQQELAYLKQYISPEWPVVIPHKMYYRVIEWDENLWYYSTAGITARNPGNLRYVIYDPNDFSTLELYETAYALQPIDCIGDIVVFEVQDYKCKEKFVD